MGWLSFHSRLITGFTESFPERRGPRYLIDASHIVLYITTTPFQGRKTFFKIFFRGREFALADECRRGAIRSNNRVTHAQWKRRRGTVPIGPMKQWIAKSIQVCALLVALAVTSFAEESKRGFYEGNLAGGGRVVFFVQGNHALSTYVFDVAGHQAAFGGATVADNGTFTLTLTPSGTVTGTVNPGSVTATLLGQNVTAKRVGR